MHARRPRVPPRHLACLLVLGALGAMAPARAPGQPATPRQVINIGGIDVALDGKTGGLLSLKDAGGTEFLRASAETAGMLSIDYPVKSFAGLRLEPKRSTASITREGEATTIAWAPLAASRPGYDLPAGQVLARVTLRPAPDGRSLILRAVVENESETTIGKVLFPDLIGLRPIDAPERMELRMALGAVNPLAGPVFEPHHAPFYAPRMWHAYPAAGQYQMNALRWMDYGSLKGGLSLHERRWLEEPRATILTHRSETDPDALRIAWQHEIHLPPNGTWESAEFWLTPHRGGWAKGIEPYRDYVQRMNPEKNHPRAILEGLGMQTIWMIQTSEPEAARADFTYADLLDVARDAKVHGLNLLVLWGWCTYGHLPMRHRPELGTEEELIEAIRKAGELGVTIAPFINVKNLNDYLAPRYGVEPGNSAAWKFHPEMIPAMAPFFSDEPSGQIDIETTNTVWQQDVEETLVDWAERGAAHFCWDVFQDYGSMDLIHFIDRVRTAVRRVDPAASFGAEPYLGSFERATQVVDYTWNWVDYLEAGPYMNVLRWPRINCNVEASPLVVKMAFADGLFINAMPKRAGRPNGTALISEDAALAGALKEVANLRRQFQDYFTSGTFIGESVLAEPVVEFVRRSNRSEIGGATFVAPAFEYPEIFVRGRLLDDRLLIIVLNLSDRPREVSFASDLALWLPDADRLRVAHYDGRGELIADEELVWDRGSTWKGETGVLQPLEINLFEIAAESAQ
ncbi:MAG TPA: hypothetical protein PLS90_02100 [Candidatus Sumerlaeota bacterium]|nr:hypothetical protein [Candidatus Sumerlaeota bacterium]HPK01226.1 hypothetical protein [Candidatus Sumerlaeota bacterium]